MAIVLGTNAGFVTEAPVADPTGIIFGIDNQADYTKDTTPAGGNIHITEIGWWCDVATEAANFEVGIYDHDSGDDVPNNLIEVSRTNAKGTTAGWKTASVDWIISPETIYWIGVQLDNTDTDTYTNRSTSGGRSFYQFSKTTLPNPAGDGIVYDNRILAFYALYEIVAPVGTNMKINIADAWKDVDLIKINIGDTWKEVAEIKQNIGDVWKTVF